MMIKKKAIQCLMDIKKIHILHYFYGIFFRNNSTYIVNAINNLFFFIVLSLQPFNCTILKD